MALFLQRMRQHESCADGIGGFLPMLFQQGGRLAVQPLVAGDAVCAAAIGHGNQRGGQFEAQARHVRVEMKRLPQRFGGPGVLGELHAGAAKIQPGRHVVRIEPRGGLETFDGGARFACRVQDIAAIEMEQRSLRAGGDGRVDQSERTALVAALMPRDADQM